jgi:hypothetical protein
VQLGSYEKQKVPRCCPLLGGQVEQRSPVNFGDDAAAAWNYVGRITGVSGRGVDAELVLEVQVRLVQPVVIAKDTAFGHRTVLLAGQSEQTNWAIISPATPVPAIREPAAIRPCGCPLSSPTARLKQSTT